MKFNEIRKGNLLRYMGKLGNYYDRIAEVLSIDPTKTGENAFGLKVQDWKKIPTEIRADQTEVWPITLDVSHLEKLGFLKDKDHNIFRLNGLIVFRPIFLYYHSDHAQYVDKGFVVLNKPMNLPLTEEMVESSTTPVTSLHTFQNYLNQLGWKMEWTIFF